MIFLSLFTLHFGVRYFLFSYISQTEEELDEEERKQAWLEYEEEKKGKPLINSTNTSDVNAVNQNDIYLQQYMMNFAQSNMMHQNAMSLQFENLQQLIRETVST